MRKLSLILCLRMPSWPFGGATTTTKPLYRKRQIKHT
jgi:hypothetical protein